MLNLHNPLVRLFILILAVNKQVYTQPVFLLSPANAHVAAANSINAQHHQAYLNAAGQLPYGYTYYPAVHQAPGMYPAFTTPSVYVSTSNYRFFKRFRICRGLEYLAFNIPCRLQVLYFFLEPFLLKMLLPLEPTIRM